MAGDRYEMGRLSFAIRPATGAPGERDEPLGLDAGRDGVLYVPETAGPAAPLLVFLHGARGTGRAHVRAVLGAVDRYGVILVAPDSRGPTWDLIVERRFGPDVAFLDQVLDAVVDRVDADTRPWMASRARNCRTSAAPSSWGSRPPLLEMNRRIHPR